MSKQRILLVVLGLSVAILLSACHKTRVAATAPTTSTPSEAAPPPPSPPTCTITADPATLAMGKSATLTWSSNNASSIELDPGLGEQQAFGSLTVSPQESTTYTLKVTGPSGNASCDARVTIAIPPQTKPAVTESNLPAANVKPLQDVYFDYAMSDIRNDARDVLSGDAAYLQSRPNVKIRIEGYCDPRGSEEYNLGLGDRRATAAKTFLMNLGISADRISTISYGKDKPFCTDQTEECYQRNRRAHFVEVQP